MNIIKRIRKSASEKLKIFWASEKREFSLDNLIALAHPVYNDYLPIRKEALEEFLERIDKIYEDFLRMLNAARDILDKHDCLKQKFANQLFGLRNVDMFAELIYTGEKMAAERFAKEIKDGIIVPKQAKKVWSVLFIKFTSEESRISLWKKIKAFSPDNKEIKYLFDQDVSGEIMHSLSKIAAEARKIIEKNRKQEKKRNKFLAALKELIEKARKEEKQKQE